MTQMPKIEKPEDFEKVMEWLACRELVMTVKGVGNRAHDYGMALVRAITEQFPDEEAPAFLLEDRAVDDARADEIRIGVRKRLIPKIDTPRLHARFAEIVKSEIEL